MDFDKYYNLLKVFFLDTHERKFLKRTLLERAKISKERDKSAKVVLFETPYNYFHLVHRSLIIRDQYKSGETLIGYDPNFLNLYSSKSFIKNQVTTAKAAFVRYFYRIKWRRLYSAVGIVHQYLFKNLLLEKIFSFIEAVKIWKSLKLKKTYICLSMMELELVT